VRDATAAFSPQVTGWEPLNRSSAGKSPAGWTSDRRFSPPVTGWEPLNRSSAGKSAGGDPTAEEEMVGHE
jgi:hypothetical protein